jgi:hypothetical protein
VSFLAPFYLLLAAGAVVPLLLHLLRRRIGARVEFPAARYLQRAEREHSRSLRLRNLLLMLLRVLLVLAIALAAAGPFVRGFGAGHGPTAVAIVLDNSLSTTALHGGTPVFDRLRDAAAALLRSASPADESWLVTADGRVRGGTREALLAELERAAPIEGAGDLPLALRRAAAAVQGSRLPAQVVAIATDGQRSAWDSAARVRTPVALLSIAADAPANRAVVAASAQPARWTPGGTVIARIDAPDSVGYRVVLGDRTVARGTAGRGEPVVLHAAPSERGWLAGRVEIEPDEFRADDARYFAVWVGAPPAVASDPSAGTFAATAVAALVADGRAAAGSAVYVAAADVVTRLPALIVPPTDAVRLGAANRNLARLGIPWRFGPAQRAPVVARGARLDGIAIAERLRLVRDGAASSDTLAFAGGEPWVVAGAGYVLLASPLDPAATTLPVRAAFVPWLADMLGLRLGAPAGDLGAPIDVAPDAPVRLPAGVEMLESASGARRTVENVSMNAPAERGVWFMLRGGRRVGALVVNAPPEESALAAWPAKELASRLAGLAGRSASSTNGWVRDTFASSTRRPALVPLLVLALLLLAAEAIAVRTSRSTAA